ncbi:MAG: hypothetical protein JSS53_08505 [Proteobacteria bacterium]|nr:hypothetical protein [Pseudomonadota bacterium]
MKTAKRILVPLMGALLSSIVSLSAMAAVNVYIGGGTAYPYYNTYCHFDNICDNGGCYNARVCDRPYGIYTYGYGGWYYDRGFYYGHIHHGRWWHGGHGGWHGGGWHGHGRHHGGHHHH